MLIVSFGDIHMEPGKAKNIPELKDADLVVITGDTTNRGNDSDAMEALAPITAINPKIKILFGNMDKSSVETMFIEKGINLHAKGFLIEHDTGIIGLGGSTPTPFDTPSEFQDSDLKDCLEKAYDEVNGAKRIILFTHTPPFSTSLDKIHGGLHGGSQAVRNFIQTNQPDICICGHIHEAIGEEYMGKTHAINPGMLSNGGYAVIEITKDDISACLKNTG